jgi:hypothetical protein
MIGRPAMGGVVPQAGVAGSRCGVSVGFFALRPCGQLAAAVCGGCSRGVCSRHMTPGLAGAQPLCVECAARQREGRDYGLDDLVDEASFYVYRQGFYRRVYGSDASRSGWFDDPVDRSALDAANLGAGDLDAQADDAPGLLDS